MTVTTERKKAILGAVFFVGAVGFFLYRGAGSSLASSAPKPSPASISSATATPRSRSSEHHYVAFLLKPTTDPRLRLDLLADTEGLKYGGNGRDIFASYQDEIPKPVAPGLLADDKPAKETPAPLPPLASSTPPMTLKIWGVASQPGEPKAVFLAQGDNGTIAHEGDVVSRRYKIVKINTSSVDVEDMLGNNRQTVQISY